MTRACDSTAAACCSVKCCSNAAVGTRAQAAADQFFAQALRTNGNTGQGRMPHGSWLAHALVARAHSVKSQNTQLITPPRPRSPAR